VSDNRDQVFAALKAWQKRMDNAGFRATQLITQDLVYQAKKNASQTKNPPYMVNGKKRRHPHIGPRSGEGPNIGDGVLVRGILPGTVRRVGFESYTASASSTIEYSRSLEMGEKYQFPFMIPARDYLVQSGRASAYIRDEVRKAMGA